MRPMRVLVLFIAALSLTGCSITCDTNVRIQSAGAPVASRPFSLQWNDGMGRHYEATTGGNGMARLVTKMTIDTSGDIGIRYFKVTLDGRTVPCKRLYKPTGMYSATVWSICDLSTPDAPTDSDIREVFGRIQTK